MKRNDILKKSKIVEDLSQDEINWLNNPENERLVRRFILKNNNESDYQVNAKMGINNLINRIGLTDSGKIFSKIGNLIKNVFEDYNHVEDAKDIVKDLSNNNLLFDIKNISPTSMWSLRKNTSFSEQTKLFLIDLYDRDISFGRNSYGKGELFFALLLKGGRLSSHSHDDNGADIFAGESKIGIKSNGGRLDGRFPVNVFTIEQIKEILQKQQIKENYPKVYEFVRKNLKNYFNGSANSLDFELTEEGSKNWILFTEALISYTKEYDEGFSSWKNECEDYLLYIFTLMYKSLYHTETGTIVNIKEHIKKIIHLLENPKDSNTPKKIAREDFLLKSLLYVYKNKITGNNYLDYLILNRKVDNDVYAYCIPYGKNTNEVYIAEIWEDLFENHKVSFSKGDHTFTAPRIFLTIRGNPDVENIKDENVIKLKRSLFESITFEKSEDGNDVEINFEDGKSFNTDIYRAIEFAKNFNKKGYLTYINGELGDSEWLDDPSINSMFLRRF